MEDVKIIPLTGALLTTPTAGLLFVHAPLRTPVLVAIQRWMKEYRLRRKVSHKDEPLVRKENFTGMKAKTGPLRIPFNAAALISILATSMLSSAANRGSAVGLWRNEDATIEILEDQGRLSGKIVALREPRTPEGKEKTDIHNPDPSKRDRPILGLVFMSGFTRKSDTRWENGTVYDPKTGYTYSCFMELESPQKIKFHGYIGISLLGRTVFWTRVPDNERP